MLVLSRKVGERILIGQDIAITVVRIGQGGVRIGIDAPGDLTVVREELTDGTAVATNGDDSARSKPLPR
jgi:carbon storage regulator